MLKLCWDCIFSTNETQNDVNGRAKNGYPLGSMSHRENEMAFRLPRQLQNGDIIGVKAEIKQEDRQKFRIGLALGENYVDKHNLACEVEADFLKDIFVIRTVVNGQADDKILDPSRGNPTVSSLLPESVPVFTFEFLVNTEDDEIYIGIDQSSLDTVRLNHNLKNISYLILSDDIVKVKEIFFKYDQN